MAGLSSLVKKVQGRYIDWEKGSKEREKKRLEEVQSKRAREAIRHIYKVERANRKVEIAQHIAKAKKAELEARQVKSELRELRIKDIKGYASLFGIGRGGKTATKKTATKRKSRARR